ncbi:MAG: glycosyltransferase family 2 protein [Cyanobacteria bacterium]|nr:glycosyltransferase family 2 protein [Cyanobacteriota bacterium]MDW8202860.1 glycosyltransferase family A protein [Cyanobacteriota bacterium SKYGB_h_bin112]
MNPPPLVSVLMSVYNSERYLAQAIESILHQSFTDFEFIIIDDGSTDRSLEILQAYAQRDPRIQLISRENRGLARTKNELVSLARGEFLAIMDSDDVAMPDRLAHQVAFLRANPDVVCVGGAYDFIDEAGRLLEHVSVPLTDADLQRFALQGKVLINHPSAMIRRQALEQVGGYDETMHTDGILDLWLRLGEVGKLANLAETVLHYRQHQHSVSEQKQWLQLEDKREACERAWRRRGITGTFAETTPWRPVDRPSRYHYYLKYGWSFLNRREWGAAIIYGFRAMRELPWKRGAWKLLTYGVIKYLTTTLSSWVFR